MKGGKYMYNVSPEINILKKIKPVNLQTYLMICMKQSILMLVKFAISLKNYNILFKKKEVRENISLFLYLSNQTETFRNTVLIILLIQFSKNLGG